MGGVQGAHIGREERALFDQAGEFCIFTWRLSLKGENSSLHLAGSEGRHHLAMVGSGL